MARNQATGGVATVLHLQHRVSGHGMSHKRSRRNLPWGQGNVGIVLDLAVSTLCQCRYGGQRCLMLAPTLLTALTTKQSAATHPVALLMLNEMPMFNFIEPQKNIEQQKKGIVPVFFV